jgi:hypothetical protein
VKEEEKPSTTRTLGEDKEVKMTLGDDEEVKMIVLKC